MVPRTTLIRLPLTIALVCAMVRQAVPQQLRRSDLERQPRWPSWIRPRRARIPDSKPYLAFGDSRRSADRMRHNVGVLWYLATKEKGNPNRPFWMLKLGQHFTDLDADHEAYFILSKVLELDPDTPHNSGIYGFGRLADVQREARFLRARVLARNRLQQEALADLEDLPSRTGHDRNRHAEALALMGDGAKALTLLNPGNARGHPAANWSSTFVPLRSALLAFGLGDQSLAQRFGEGVLKRGRTSQKWPQWQASWSILDRVARRVPAVKPSRDRLRSGVFSGECHGFIQGVRVSVRVRNGRITDVDVDAHREDRPWSAIEVIPQRIARRQSLAVDTVTGATITTGAIVGAVNEALRNAVQ